jgi:hypothetical protein
VCKDSWHKTLKAQKTKIEKFLRYFKLKILCTAKTITRVERHSTEWRKIFPMDTFDRGLISRIHKELQKIQYQKLLKGAIEFFLK